MYLPGDKPWYDYQTGREYAPGWRKIKADGPVQCVIMVRDGAALPHAKVAQHTGEIDWDNIEWRFYGSARKGDVNRKLVRPEVSKK